MSESPVTPVTTDDVPVTCHAWTPIPRGGVWLCTRPKGHRTNHIDGVHNKSWPQEES